MKAALARAAGYVAANTYEVEAEKPVRDMAAEIALLQANSARFFAEDAADEPSEEALVPVTCACPKCGEMRMDCLSRDEDIVTCVTCGEVYDISPAARLDQVMPDDISDIGIGDDYGPNFWTMRTAEIAGAYSPRCD